MVEHGEADYLHRGRASPELFTESETQYGGQWHVASFATYAAWMNTAVPPFNNLDVRRAVNFAINRTQMADVYGGPPFVSITCQILPPGFPGYQPYCPYTLDRDAGGHWRAPDLKEAQRLVDASGTAGMHVVVGPNLESFSAERDYLGSVLKELGYDVFIDKDTDFEHYEEAYGGIQIFPIGWGPDYLAPSIFFSPFTCADSVAPLNFCDKEFDRAFKKALDLQAGDPSAAWALWADLDRRAVDLGLWAPLYNVGSDFVSARVGNYQFSPTGSVLFDQMWVQSAPPLAPASPSSAPSVPPPPSTPPNPLVGTWLAPVVTCAQEIAVIEAAGYTADQVTSVGFDPTCAKSNIGTEVRNTNRYSLVFDGLPAAATFRSMRTFDYGAFNSPHDYSLTGDTTFELGGRDGGVWDYCLTFKFAIDGDQLTVDMVDPRCPGTGDAPLQDQIALTAIFETSSFTRQP
jgi:hypothetical protein